MTREVANLIRENSELLQTKYDFFKNKIKIEKYIKLFINIIL